MEVLPGVREGRRQEKGLLGAYSRHSPSQVMEQVTLRVPAPSQTTVVPPIRYSESAARKLLCQDLSHPSKGLLGQWSPLTDRTEQRPHLSAANDLLKPEHMEDVFDLTFSHPF